MKNDDSYEYVYDFPNGSLSTVWEIYPHNLGGRVFPISAYVRILDTGYAIDPKKWAEAYNWMAGIAPKPERLSLT